MTRTITSFSAADQQFRSVVVGRVLFIFSMLLLPGLLGGCARMQRIEKSILSTEQRVEKLEAQVKELTKTIEDLNVHQGGATNKMKADLTMLLKELGDQLDKQHANMDESQYRLMQLEKKLDILSGSRLVTTGDSGHAGRPSPDTGSSIKSGVIPGLDIEKLYHQAREDYIIGKYDLAYKGFRTVLEKDQGGTYKDNALYWMGECFYKQKEYEKAAEYYSRCVNEYPQGNKTCTARFKLGLVQELRNDIPGRNSHWQALISMCPSSNEAHRAQEMMKSEN